MSETEVENTAFVQGLYAVDPIVLAQVRHKKASILKVKRVISYGSIWKFILLVLHPCEHQLTMNRMFDELKHASKQLVFWPKCPCCG